MTANSAVVVATNTPAPINDWFGIYTKQAAYRTYVDRAAQVPRGAVADVLWWDNGDPYHYVRLEASDPPPPGRDGQDLLIVGGEDHKTGQLPPGPIRSRTSSRGRARRSRSWATSSVGGPGRCRSRPTTSPTSAARLTGGENVYVAPATAAWASPTAASAGVDPHRPDHGPPESLGEDLRPRPQDARPRLRQGERQHRRSSTPTGSPAATSSPSRRSRPAKAASCATGSARSPSTATSRTASTSAPPSARTCSCIVQWNPYEKTWDCPCHGSRFDPYGKVLMGPAVDDLEKAE